MLLDNKNLVFGVVEDGRFYQPIKPVPFSIKLGQQYHFRIEIINDLFRSIVDGNEMLSVRAKRHNAKENDKFVLIFYDSGSNNEIKAKLKDVTIYKGK